ncbi:MAG: hypothetical protein WCP06_10000 [Verrucomicrobiota bacterium]
MKNHFEEATGAVTKLELLRSADSRHAWKSLSDELHCILCERTISGQNVKIVYDRCGVPELRCSTHGCKGTPSEWVHPENPLISEDAWRDWVRLLETLSEHPEQNERTPVRRQFRPSHKRAVSSSVRLAS